MLVENRDHIFSRRETMSTIRLILYTNLVLVTLACAGYSPRMSGKAAQSEGFIEIDGGQLYYEVAGEGETIIMVHDGLLHRETWNLQFDDLAKDHRVIRYDRRGYGKSPAPEEPFSPVEDLDAVFQQLRVKKALLMGMSAGGRLAVDYALAYPAKVTALVLVGPVVSGMNFTNHFFDRGGRLTQEILSDRDTWRNYYVHDDPYTITLENDAARALAVTMLDANPHNFNAENYQLAQLPERTALGRLAEIAVHTHRRRAHPLRCAGGGYPRCPAGNHPQCRPPGSPGSARSIPGGGARFHDRRGIHVHSPHQECHRGGGVFPYPAEAES
jgi:pimeloyl-ACP methyl ester carboxylesterase